MNLAKVGAAAFIVGVVIAVIAGLVPNLDAGMQANVVAVLAVLGLIVGLINLSEKETTPFLVAAIALAISAGSLNVIPAIGGAIGAILSNIVAFVAPAAIIVALKAIYNLAAKPEGV